MTDLVKVYNAKGPAVAAAKKADLTAAALVAKRGQYAIVERPKVRAHVIKTPGELTIREFVWAQCNLRMAEFSNHENSYKLTRRAVIEDAVKAGYKLSGIQAEISRWRHRFN